MSFNSRKQLAQNIVQTPTVITGNWTTVGQLLTGVYINSMDMSRDGTKITLGRPTYTGYAGDQMHDGVVTIFDYDTTSKTWVKRLTWNSPIIASWGPIYPDYNPYGDGNGNCLSTLGYGTFGTDVAINNSTSYYYSSHYTQCRNYTSSSSYTYSTARVYYKSTSFVSEPATNVSEYFGYSIDCSDDGECFIVGSPGTETAYIYNTIQGSSYRLIIPKTVNGNPTTTGQTNAFGSNVCVSGNGITYCINGDRTFDIEKFSLTTNTAMSVVQYHSISSSPYTFTFSSYTRRTRLNYDGTILAIGNMKSNNYDTVAVYIKKQVGTSSWQYQLLGLPIIAESTSLNFGDCFDINDDGNIIAIGLTDYNSAATIKNTNPRIRLYQFDGDDWVLVSEKSLDVLPSVFLPPKDMTLNRVRVDSSGRIVAVSNLYFTQVLNF